MKTFRFRTFAAGLTIIALLGTADQAFMATAIAAKKAKKEAGASPGSTDRQAKPAASKPLEKSKPSAKSSTPTKPKRRTKPNKGVFAADITTKGRTRTIKSPASAASVLRRAAAAKRRADKTGKADDTFKAVITLNDVRIEFTDPALAEDACRELVKVLVRARKERILLGDIGRIELADMVIDKALPGTDSTQTTTPKVKKKRRPLTRKQRKQAAAQANARLLAIRRALQLRINMKIQMEVRKNQGRRLSQSRINQIVQAEIERARKDGLIPADMQNGGFGGTGSANRGNRETRIQTFRRELGRAFAKGKRLDAAN